MAFRCPFHLPFNSSMLLWLTVYENPPPATVNFCTLHSHWTSLLLSILKGKILPDFLVRYCRKMTHFTEPDFLSRAQMFRHVVRWPFGLWVRLSAKWCTWSYTKDRLAVGILLLQPVFNQLLIFSTGLKVFSIIQWMFTEGLFSQQPKTAQKLKMAKLGLAKALKKRFCFVCVVDSHPFFFKKRKQSLGIL